jgi:alpha-glucosidase (family GH31 glycosyl hydrolase)
LTDFCNLLVGISLLLSPLALCAQSGAYSSSPEYQQMLEELRAPSPSLAYIATGQKQLPDQALAVHVRDKGPLLQLRTKAIEITVDKSRATLTLVNLLTNANWIFSFATTSPGQPVSIQRQLNTWSIATPGAGAIHVEFLHASLVRLTWTGPDGALTMHAEGTAPIFGLGERFFQAGLADIHLDVRPADKSGEPGHNWVYVAIPLVYTPTGLGLYADTIFDTRFRFNQAGSSFDFETANHAVSFYLMCGADAKAILEQYTGITGRPQNPPLWTFGPWINAVQGKDAVLNLAQRVRDEGIPASALWVFDELDEPNNLGWPFWFSSYYGDARAFNDELHARGFKVLGYVHPYIRERMLPYPDSSEAYQKGVAEKLLVTGADGLPHGPGFEPVRTGNLDFTNPRAVDWWQTMLIHAVHDQGWDGWMEDFGEWVDDTDHFAAGDGTRLAEVYPLLYHKITTRIVQAMNPQVVSFSRSGSPGSQAFSPVLWGADQAHDWSRDQGLPSVVTAGITAGMSGYSTWGPDILSDGNSKELWLRWAEFGALTPVMRDHVWSKPQFSVSLWYDAQTIALFKKYAILHSTLLPYFATYAEQAHRTGVPIMRHTVLEYPNDPRSATAEYQYLLGEYLLVAPVIEPGATTRRLYLPQGEWLNYWTGERYAGAADVTVPAPIDQVPLMVRSGSVIPFKPEVDVASLKWSDPNLLSGSLVWKIYPPASDGKVSGFTLPDSTQAQARNNRGTLQVDGTSPATRPYEVIVWMRSAPQVVLLDSKPLAVLPDETAHKPDGGWWFDPLTHQLHAVFLADKFHLEISGGTL